MARARGPRGSGAPPMSICPAARLGAALRAGRYSDAMEALRDGGLELRATERAHCEAEALQGLHRHREAADAARRGLGLRPAGEEAARLRLLLGHALWSLGEVARGEAEVERALVEGEAPRLRARCRELLGLFAWKRGEHTRADAELSAASELYAALPCWEGTASVLARRAGLLADRGEFRSALAACDLALEAASATTRVDLIAHVRCEKGELLVRTGRWSEGRDELDRAAALYRAIADPREVTLAGRRRARIDLAAGNLEAVREAAQLLSERVDAAPHARLRAEERLLAADVALAEGDAETARDASGEALALCSAARDAEGECRARVRIAHALVSLGSYRRAELEARRALGLAASEGSMLPALAELARGRALLGRGRRDEAVAAFVAAERRSAAVPGLAHAARLGRLLSQGTPGDAPGVVEALEGLEAWGERRILAECRAELGRGPGRTGDPEAPAPPERRELRELRGDSPQVARLRDDLARLATVPLPVHLFGETGTGKEGAARALHALSGRRGSFVGVNCAGLSEELFHSQMFGHSRGSFTGAVADRPGLVAEADGGTLFLDEIADLSPSNQGRLLRFLESGEYRRLGELTSRRAEVRVVSAANVALAERVTAGRFREDLVYRLAVLVVELPPLRERIGDAVTLARHFARELGKQLSAPVSGLLGRQAWPGNVRELKAEVQRACFQARGPEVCLEDLSPRLRRGERPRVATTLREFLGESARRHIAATLAAHGGCRAAAAAALGISRQALHGHIVRLGL